MRAIRFRRSFRGWVSLDQYANSVLKLAATVENLGAAAYLGQAGTIQSPEVLASALAIHAVEGRHAAALNTLLGQSITPDGAFAKPATSTTVLAAVNPQPSKQSPDPMPRVRIAAEVAQLGQKALPICADVSVVEDVQNMIAGTMNHFGHLDVMFNNAGIGGTTPVLDLQAAEWDRYMNLNLKGPVLCSKHIGAEMIKRKQGNIINVSSLFSKMVARYMAAYGATKSALVSFTRTLALESVSFTATRSPAPHASGGRSAG
jgi:rubrerythrin